MSKVGICFGLSLAVAAGGCLDSGPDVSGSDQDIIGGTRDTGDPAVVALRFTVPPTSVEACTATVIAPKVLLTAGHCTSGAVNFQYNPASSVDATVNTGWISAAYGISDPAYDGNAAHGHDVGLVVLTTATTIAPRALGAAPAVNAAVRTVGYGLTTTGTTGPYGVKYTKNITVDAVTAHEFVTGPNDTCHGDSGGPVFNSAGAVVGTTSYGDTANCVGNDHFMRIDDNRAWIDATLASVASGGSAPCSTQITVNGVVEKISCSGTSCQCSVNGSVVRTCTASATQCGIPGDCCGF